MLLIRTRRRRYRWRRAFATNSSPTNWLTKTFSFSLFSHTHTTASKFKQVRRGVKEVVKQLKTAREGLCVIAGDISPIDVITHVPMLCEEAGVQYVYVHSKEQLGAAGMTKRPTSVMLVLPKAVKGSVKMGKDDEKEFEEMYKSVHSKVKGMHEK
jgi:H/ACA ribonucleoprotein complex subunit 2|tara:strand:+ start:33 stop:497 length:465 start_codon:yes stop_codon:yes gene_type:complete